MKNYGFGKDDLVKFSAGSFLLEEAREDFTLCKHHCSYI